MPPKFSFAICFVYYDYSDLNLINDYLDWKIWFDNWLSYNDYFTFWIWLSLIQSLISTSLIDDYILQ